MIRLSCGSGGAGSSFLELLLLACLARQCVARCVRCRSSRIRGRWKLRCTSYSQTKEIRNLTSAAVARAVARKVDLCAEGAA